MKVLYLHKRHPIEPLGIGYVSSSIARNGHKSKLILSSKDVGKAADHVSKEIEECKPDIFAQSIIFGSHRYAIELNKIIKEKYPRIISVLGGPAGTFTPELIERGFDVLCRYEGENPFLEFCDALENRTDIGNIPNLWVKENPNLYLTEVKKTKEILDIDNPHYKDESGFDSTRKRFVNTTRPLLEGSSLNEIPLPDRELLYTQAIWADSPIKHFMHTRGCAFKCAYCFNVVQNMENRGKGTTVRRRAHESVAEEINQVKEKWPIELVYFQDDIFGPIYRLNDALEFAEVYSKEVGLPFHCHARFDLISRDERIAKAFAEAGCTGVHIAIEAGDEFIRNEVHQRGMSTEQILTGAEYLRKYGIKMMTQNILGAPGETKEQMLKTLELNIAVKPLFASASIFQPYPGTSALEYARDKGTLPAKGLNELIDQFGLETFYNKSILALDPREKRWLEVFQKFFAIAVETPRLYKSGVLERVVSSLASTYSTDLQTNESDNSPLPRTTSFHPGSDGIDKELENMYRLHRAEKDQELYGVKLNDIVEEEN